LASGEFAAALALTDLLAFSPARRLSALTVGHEVLALGRKTRSVCVRWMFE
jgi:hypothetical protein